MIYAASRRELATAVIVVTFCAVSAVVFLGSYRLRTFTRWLLWSGQYKQEVLTEPTPFKGDLKHIEWDGWGGFGQDFTVFLVFDPTDSLSEPARNDQFGKFKGVP